MRFWLLSKGVATIIKNICDFDIAGSCGCAKVFKFLSHLGTGAHTAILLGNLYNYNFSLSKGPSCFRATAVHKIFVGFPYRSLQDFEGRMVNVNKFVNK